MAKLRPVVEQMTVDNLEALKTHQYLLSKYFGEVAKFYAADEQTKPLAVWFEKIASQYATNQDVYQQVAERMQQRRQKMFKRIRGWMLIGVLAAVVGIVPMTVAQEIVQTAEPTAVVEVTEAAPVGDVVVVDTGEDSPPVIIVREEQPAAEPINWQWLSITVIAVALVWAIPSVLRPLILNYGSQMPVIAYETSMATINKLLEQGQQWAGGTPSTIDDQAFTELVKLVGNLDMEIRQIRAGQRPTDDTQPLEELKE